MTPPDTNPRITFKEVLELGVAEGTLKRRLIKREWDTVVVGIARNGKPVREIVLASLPRDLQLRWGQKQRAEAAVASEATTQPSIQDHCAQTESRLNEALKRYDAEARAAFLIESQRLAVIVERYDAIDTKRTRSESAKLEFVPAVLALCAEAICADQIVLAREPRRAQCPSPYTLDGWSRRFKNDGLLTFLRSPATKAGSNSGGGHNTPPLNPGTRDRRTAIISEGAIEWVNSNWRKHPTARSLYRKLKKLAQKNGWKIPSEAS